MPRTGMMGDNFEPVAIPKREDGEYLVHGADSLRLPDFNDARHRGAGNGRLVIYSKLGASIVPGTHAVVSVEMKQPLALSTSITASRSARALVVRRYFQIALRRFARRLLTNIDRVDQALGCSIPRCVAEVPANSQISHIGNVNINPLWGLYT
jgi:hypothetical protein